jgi:hypothetical protein
MLDPNKRCLAQTFRRRTDLEPRANLHELSAAQAGDMLNVSGRASEGGAADADLRSADLRVWRLIKGGHLFFAKLGRLKLNHPLHAWGCGACFWFLFLGFLRFTISMLIASGHNQALRLGVGRLITLPSITLTVQHGHP